MKVLLDQQIFEIQNFGGISKYFSELVDTSKKFNEIHFDLPMLYSNNNYVKNITTNPLIQPFPEFTTTKIPFSSRRSIFTRMIDRYRRKKFYDSKLANCYQLNRQLIINKLKESNFDVYHPTYYDDFFLEYIKDKPFVLTVHDLIHQIFPEFFPLNTIDKSQKLLDKATRVIVISENTKNDLINFFDIDKDKIDVIYLASVLQEKEKNTEPLSSINIVHNVEKYLLFVGKRWEYKNFYFFCSVIAPILREDKDLFLICTGSQFSMDELTFFSKLGIQNKIKHIYAKDSELYHLYSGALAFVYPSLYEGFGIPIIEAFACGCPVICSSTSCFPEIAKDAAVYFQPKDKDSMYNAVRTVLHDTQLREDMALRGYRQLNRFSWQETYKKTKVVYDLASIAK